MLCFLCCLLVFCWCCVWLFVWLLCVAVLFWWFCLALHPVLPSCKSYEAQEGLSEMGTRPDAWDVTSRVLSFVVSLLVKDCQYPRDPLQPARKKKSCVVFTW